VNTFAPHGGYHPPTFTNPYLPEPIQQAPQQEAAEDPCLCDQLILLSSLLLGLRDQAHLIHISYVGHDFISVHSWLKERYEEHAEQFDAIAELVRIHGAMLPNTVNELRNCLPQFDGKACLCSYLSNIENLAAAAINLEKKATGEWAIDVSDAMVDLSRSAGKTIWFLKAMSASS
jgi:DNA-binding ferritin-like protein